GPPIAHQRSRVDAPMLGIFLFIASEIMLFGAFFTAYFFVRVAAGTPWPTPPFHLPVFVAGVNTAILVTSSFTMHWALQSIKRDNHNGLKAGMLLTFLLGLTFLVTQAREYSRIGFNTGDGGFATIFFCLTGLHGAHVFVGLFVGLTAVGAWFLLQKEETGEMTRAIPARGPADERRILVVANETVGGQTLRQTIREKTEGARSQVLVVTPALNSPLKHWVS